MDLVKDKYKYQILFKACNKLLPNRIQKWFYCHSSYFKFIQRISVCGVKSCNNLHEATKLCVNVNQLKPNYNQSLLENYLTGLIVLHFTLFGRVFFNFFLCSVLNKDWKWCLLVCFIVLFVCLSFFSYNLVSKIRSFTGACLKQVNQIKSITFMPTVEILTETLLMAK